MICGLMLDHLVYGAPDLEEATMDFERRLGVRPNYGGKHTGGLTHNALVSLGELAYLEIIAEVPGAATQGAPLAFGLETLEAPRLVTWSMKAPDIDRKIGEARARGYDPGDPVDGGRDLPDGSRLSWRVSLSPQLAGDGIVPFLTQWKSAPGHSSAEGLPVRLAEGGASGASQGASHAAGARRGVERGEGCSTAAHRNTRDAKRHGRTVLI